MSCPADGVVVHVSGCAKGCAHPAAAPLTIVGTRGAARVIADGTAQRHAVVPMSIASKLAAQIAASSAAQEAVDA